MEAERPGGRRAVGRASSRAAGRRVIWSPSRAAGRLRDRRTVARKAERPKREGERPGDWRASGQRPVEPSGQRTVPTRLRHEVPQNTQRDLLRLLSRRSELPELYEADIPLWDKNEGPPYTGKLYFLLPHEVLHTIAGENVGEWTSCSVDQQDLSDRRSAWCQSLNLQCPPEEYAILGRPEKLAGPPSSAVPPTVAPPSQRATWPPPPALRSAARQPGLQPACDPPTCPRVFSVRFLPSAGPAPPPQPAREWAQLSPPQDFGPTRRPSTLASPCTSSYSTWSAGPNTADSG